jgi:hypothetical protein
VNVQTSKSGFVRTEEQAQLDTEALRLRSRGITYREIATFQGVTVAAAYNRVKRALGEIPKAVADEVRRVELEKLDQWEQATIRILEKFHPYVTMSGKLVELSDGRLETPIAVLGDDEPAMKALNTLMKIQDQRAKLLGLYAAKQLQVEITTYEGGGEVERELERLAESLALRAGSSESIAVGEGTSPAGADTTEGRVVVNDDVQSGTRVG